MVCDSAVDRFRIGNGIIQSAEFRRGREDNAPSFSGLMFGSVHSHFRQTSYNAIKKLVGQDLSFEDFNRWSSHMFLKVNVFGVLLSRKTGQFASCSRSAPWHHLFQLPSFFLDPGCYI